MRLGPGLRRRRASAAVTTLLLSAGCAQLIGAEFDGARLPDEVLPPNEAGTGETGTSSPDTSMVDSPTDAQAPFDARADALVFWVSADQGVMDGGAPEAGPDGSSLAARWLDQSGHTHDLTQKEVGKQPLFVPGAQNGLPAVRFERSRSTCYGSTWLGLAGQTGVTVFVVSKGSPTSLLRFQGGGTGYLVFPWNARANEPDAAPDYFFLVATPTGSNQIRLSVDENAWALSVARLEMNKVGGMQVYANGTLLEAASVMGDAGPVSKGFQVGCAPGQLGELANADVGELLVYAEALPDVERVAVEKYLKTKWALAF